MSVSKVQFDGNTLINLENDTVTANKMLSGTKAHDKNGDSITGNIASKASATYTPTTTDQMIAAGQYLAGAQTIKGDANLVAGNIKKDVTIFGKTGTYEGGGKGGDYDIIQNIDGDNCSLAISDANTFTVIPKTITENGTYAAVSDNADGFSSVTVDVSGVETVTLTVNFIPISLAYLNSDLVWSNAWSGTTFQVVKNSIIIAAGSVINTTDLLYLGQLPEGPAFRITGANPYIEFDM